MSYIQRQLPQSNVARRTALNKAYDRLTSAGNPYGNFISTAVFTRLTNIRTSYNTAMEDVNPHEENLRLNTAQQNPVLEECRRWSVLFVRGINLGIDIGIYTASIRAFYNLPVETGNLPPLKSKTEIIEFAQGLVTGEAERVADGGAPATYPAISVVQTPLTALNPLLQAEEDFKLVLEQAQETVNHLNTEADEVIKKTWGEIEVFFNHEEKESQRLNCRTFGIVYVSRGPKVAITFHITGGTLPQVLQTVVTMNQTGHKETPDPELKAVFNTSVRGPVEFEVKTPGCVIQTIPVTITDNNPQTINVVLQPL